MTILDAVVDTANQSMVFTTMKTFNTEPEGDEWDEYLSLDEQVTVPLILKNPNEPMFTVPANRTELPPWRLLEYQTEEMVDTRGYHYNNLWQRRVQPTQLRLF